jgi:hypothetical protein
MDIEQTLIRAIESSQRFPKNAFLEWERFTGCKETTVLAENVEKRSVLLDQSPAIDTRLRLEAFVANLSPWIGKKLIGGCLWTPTHRYWVFVDPMEEKLVHWEEYPRGT